MLLRYGTSVKKIYAMCITQSVKKLQLGKTGKCYTPYTQRQILACFFQQVYTAVIHINAKVISRNTWSSMLPVTWLAISQLLSWFIGENFDRLTHHHTLNTLHINSGHEIKGALNSIKTGHCVVHATQKWLKNWALLCHISTCLYQSATIIKQSLSDKPTCKNMKQGEIPFSLK
jgi:hypothetical protein